MIDLHKNEQPAERLKRRPSSKICVTDVAPIKGYGKYGWAILFVFWALHLVLSARDFLPNLQDLCLACASGAQTPIQAVTSMTWSQLVSSNPKLASFLASTLVDDGISGIGDIDLWIDTGAAEIHISGQRKVYRITKAVGNREA